jgi:hypothetical protein
MELYLIPDDPSCTLLISTNNVTHYKILTHTNLGLCMSRLINTTMKKHRPGIQLGSAAATAYGSGNGSHARKDGPSSGTLVADIVWGDGRTGTPTNIISDAIDPDLRITRRRWLKKNVKDWLGGYVNLCLCCVDLILAGGWVYAAAYSCALLCLPLDLFFYLLVGHQGTLYTKVLNTNGKQRGKSS